MQSIAREVKTTYSDILSLGETHQRIEIFDGECVISPLPTVEHQLVAMRLGIVLSQLVDRLQSGIVLGPVDVVISPTMVLQPDLCYLSNERASLNDGKKFNGVPDLVVEILSESTEERDRTFKSREYARGGAKEYWIVDPSKKEIEVFTNSPKGFQLTKVFGGNEILSTPLFPSAAILLKEVFR